MDSSEETEMRAWGSGEGHSLQGPPGFPALLQVVAMSLTGSHCVEQAGLGLK